MLFYRIKKCFAIVLAIALLFLQTGISYASARGEFAGHWAETILSDWISKGLIQGYGDGTFRPDHPITRAEFMALVNRSFAYQEQTGISYSDVPKMAWYYSTVAAAVKAGYIGGYPDGTMKPDSSISRQEAAVIVGRLQELQQASGSLNYSDSIPDWSKGYIGAVAKAGFMTGYPDSTFRPKNSITRAEAAVILGRVKEARAAETKTFNQAGTYGPTSGTETLKNVVVKTTGVTLENMTIEGDLIIAAEVAEGEATLKNVTVKGTTYVLGGGQNSVNVRNSRLNKVIVNKAAGNVRIVTDGKTNVTQVTIQSGARLDGKYSEIIIDAPKDAIIILNGVFDKVTVISEGVTIQIPAGAKVGELVLDGPATVTGQGTVELARVNSSGVVFAKAPVSQIIAEGVSPPTISHPTTPPTGGGGENSDGGSPPIIPTVPGELYLTLEQDTGQDPGDGITHNGTILVSGLVSGATWEYSLDHGATWQAGSGAALILTADGTYEVIARQAVNGMTGAPSAVLAFTLDKTPPVAPMLSFTGTLNVLSETTAITDNPEITISGLETAAIWEYSVNGGISWNPGSGSAFSLNGSAYEVNNIIGRQIDVAGNISSTSSNLNAEMVYSALAPILNTPVNNFSMRFATGIISESADVTLNFTVTANTSNDNRDHILITGAAGNRFLVGLGNAYPIFEAHLPQTVAYNISNDVRGLDLSNNGIIYSTNAWNPWVQSNFFYGSLTFSEILLNVTGPAAVAEIILDLAQPVTEVSLTGFVAPATGATPIGAAAISAGHPSYTVTSLTWADADNPYQAGKVYVATVELTSAAGYKFPAVGLAPTVNIGTPSAGTVAGGDVSGNTLTFTVAFPATSLTGSYQYYRWVISEIRDIDDIEAVGVQASQFQFYKDEIPQNMSEMVESITGVGNPAWSETVDKLIDGNFATKWLNFEITTALYPYAYTGTPASVTFEFKEPHHFTSYNWATAAGWGGADSEKARDPASWRIEASNDGIVWLVIHEVTDYNATSHAAWQEGWNLGE